MDRVGILLLPLALLGCFDSELEGLRCDAELACVVAGHSCVAGRCLPLEAPPPGDVFSADFAGELLEEWEVEGLGEASAAELSGGALRLTAGPASGDAVSLSAQHSALPAFDLRARVALDAVDLDYGLIVGLGAGALEAASLPDDGVFVELRPLNSSLRFFALDGGEVRGIGVATLEPELADGDLVDLRLRLEGDAASVSAWPSLDPEPGSPTVSGALAAPFGGGNTRLSLRSRAETSVEIALTNLEVSTVP